MSSPHAYRATPPTRARPLQSVDRVVDTATEMTDRAVRSECRPSRRSCANSRPIPFRLRAPCNTLSQSRSWGAVPRERYRKVKPDFSGLGWMAPQ